MDHIEKRFKDSEGFRREAVQMGLAYNWPDAEMPKRYFSFYINMTGDLFTPQDPMSLVRLILLGQKYSTDGSGDHRIILTLYANMVELESGAAHVYWDYEMNTHNPILLADWLLQKANPKTIEEKWEVFQFLKFVYGEIFRKPVPLVAKLFWWM